MSNSDGENYSACEENIVAIVYFSLKESGLRHRTDVSHLIWPHFLYHWFSKCGPWTISHQHPKS